MKTKIFCDIADIELVKKFNKKSMTRSLSDDHPNCEVYKILAPFYSKAIDYRN